MGTVGSPQRVVVVASGDARRPASFSAARAGAEAFASILKRETGRDTVWGEMVNIHHNYCECERCRYYDDANEEWREEDLWVTRKGATSARAGELGIIPGSMGTGSYIVRGRGEHFGGPTRRTAVFPN